MLHFIVVAKYTLPAIVDLIHDYIKWNNYDGKIKSK